jgi:hypothetical protein
MNNHITAPHTTMKSVTAVLDRSLENMVYDVYSLEAWHDKFGMELERTAQSEVHLASATIFQ